MITARNTPSDCQKFEGELHSENVGNLAGEENVESGLLARGSDTSKTGCIFEVHLLGNPIAFMRSGFVYAPLVALLDPLQSHVDELFGKKGWRSVTAVQLVQLCTICIV